MCVSQECGLNRGVYKSWCVLVGETPHFLPCTCQVCTGVGGREFLEWMNKMLIVFPSFNTLIRWLLKRGKPFNWTSWQSNICTITPKNHCLILSPLSAFTYVMQLTAGSVPSVTISSFHLFSIISDTPGAAQEAEHNKNKEELSNIRVGKWKEGEFVGRWVEEVQTPVPGVAELGHSNYSLFCGWCSVIIQ